MEGEGCRERILEGFGDGVQNGDTLCLSASVGFHCLEVRRPWEVGTFKNHLYPWDFSSPKERERLGMGVEQPL